MVVEGHNRGGSWIRHRREWVASYWGKAIQYRKGIAERTGMGEAGGEEERDENVVW